MASLPSESPVVAALPRVNSTSNENPTRRRSPQASDGPQLQRTVSRLDQPRASAQLLETQLPTASVDAVPSDPWAGDQICFPDRGSIAKRQYVCFRVLARPPRGGKVLVCGAWDELGKWDETYALELLPEIQPVKPMTGAYNEGDSWVSLCVTVPEGSDAWPLQYFYLLREGPAQDGTWRESQPCLWEAPPGTPARNVIACPPAGCVLVLRDVFGEDHGCNQRLPNQTLPAQPTISATPPLKAFLDDQFRASKPNARPGTHERPYQFCTKDLLFTVLIYWPSDNAEQKQQGRRLPLLLYLHGYFDRSPHNSVMPGVAHKSLNQSPCNAGCSKLLSQFCVCSPLAPAGYYWMRKDPTSLGGGLSGSWHFEEEYRPAMAEALRDLVQWLHSTLPIDPSRTYLSGNSMGGYGAWELARVYPDMFAALCITCGHYEPCSPQRLARLVNALVRAKLPIWVFHGRDDDVCVFQEAEELVRLFRLQEDGSSRVRLTTDGIRGHDAWTIGYSEGSGVFEWMLQHSKATTLNNTSVKGKATQEHCRVGATKYQSKGCSRWLTCIRKPRETE